MSKLLWLVKHLHVKEGQLILFILIKYFRLTGALFVSFDLFYNLDALIYMYQMWTLTFFNVHIWIDSMLEFLQLGIPLIDLMLLVYPHLVII